MVKEYLREADGIWIVASINRAVNDKTAKNMLGESFRRELLMDGQYNQVCFIATQSDVQNRSDIKRSLGLDAECTAKECAVKRNEFTKDRILKDFYAGLEEMARHGGKAAETSAELRSRYQLPVFCVSAVDFQKLNGSRLYDGAPNVWDDIEDTQIPSVQRFLHELVLKKRFDRAHASVTALVNFCDSIESFLAPDSEAQGASVDKAAVRAHALDAFDKQERSLSSAIEKHCLELSRKMDVHFNGTIGPQLLSGAEQASHVCMDTARGWASGDTKMHWATYKAHCRRNGVFRRDFNQELAENVNVYLDPQH